MKKIIIGSICGIILSNAYCSDINICFANGKHNESDNVTLLFRHGDTGVAGHENYSVAKVTSESLEKSAKIGNILRNGETDSDLKFMTDCSIRGNDTAKSMSGDFLFSTSNDFFEFDLKLSGENFTYLNTKPHTLHAALDMFISNIHTGSLSEHKKSLSKVKDMYDNNARVIISRFLLIVENQKFSEICDKIRAIAKISSAKKNIIIHHSIFISLMMYYAKLNEIYKASNLLELRDKIDYDLHNNPRDTYKQCLYILGNSLARYRLKNLEFVYLTVGKNNGVSNLRICNYNYIKDNNLYLSNNIAIRKSTPIKEKLKSAFGLFCQKPSCVTFCENVKNAVNFLVVKDTIQKKDVRLLVKTEDEKTNDKPMSTFMTFLTAPLRFIRTLHTYDDCW